MDKLWSQPTFKNWLVATKSVIYQDTGRINAAATIDNQWKNGPQGVWECFKAYKILSRLKAISKIVIQSLKRKEADYHSSGQNTFIVSPCSILLYLFEIPK